MLVEIIRVAFVFFFKQKTAYEMRISDWSSDVCSSDLQFVDPRRRRDIGHDAPADGRADHAREQHRQVAEAFADRSDLAREVGDRRVAAVVALGMPDRIALEPEHAPVGRAPRTEEHPSALQPLMRIQYTALC